VDYKIHLHAEQASIAYAKSNESAEWIYAKEYMTYKAEYSLSDTKGTCVTPSEPTAWREVIRLSTDDDDDVYLDKLQTRGIKKNILYIWKVDYS
jgi:hypothetical protein